MRGITLKKVWSDENLVEFEITTSDGCSTFCVKVYAGLQSRETLAADLERFAPNVFGGIYDIEFGKFGPEYTSGAFRARLNFDMEGRGQLFVTVRAESDWYTFSRTHVASRATLYLSSEPGLLGQFIQELRQVHSGARDAAALECVQLQIDSGPYT
jgi:hypothetical protein